MVASIKCFNNMKLSAIINVLRCSSKEKCNSIFPKLYPIKKITPIRSYCSSAVKNVSAKNQKAKKSDQINSCSSVFDEMISFRRQQAESSIMVQTSFSSSAAIQKMCSLCGTVKKVIHFTKHEKEWILLELDSKSSVKRFFESCSYPFVSPFVEMEFPPSADIRDIKHIVTPEYIAESPPCIEKQLLSARSVTDQMKIYHEKTRLSEVDERFRWMTCYQIKEIFSGMFPLLQVYPFGSSVNGCGRGGSDLDVVVSLVGRDGSSSSRSPLVFQAKPSIMPSKTQIVQYLGIYSEVLKHLATGCTEIRKIFTARVPIIKFYHQFTGLECDVSMGSLSGVYMSELLYLYGEMDCRFRPLVATVRFWASDTGLTRPVPGHTITNFTLTLLIIFYLQRLNAPILPTVDEMIELARPEDYRVTYDLECTFLRDPSIFKQRVQNRDSLETLLYGFFQFLATCDYSREGFSIVSGLAYEKRYADPLYMQNPIERDYNVSKNVSRDQVVQLKEKAGKALATLDSTLGMVGKSKWGILCFKKEDLLQSLRDKANGKVPTQKLLQGIFKSNADGKSKRFSKSKKEGRRSTEGRISKGL